MGSVTFHFRPEAWRGPRLGCHAQGALRAAWTLCPPGLCVHPGCVSSRTLCPTRLAQSLDHPAAGALSTPVLCPDALLPGIR